MKSRAHKVMEPHTKSRGRVVSFELKTSERMPNGYRLRLRSSYMVLEHLWFDRTVNVLRMRRVATRCRLALNASASALGIVV